ncbi:serine/threonine-protein kinase [Kribbella ginsengisoli]|uniref:non-specific serine/threonine protein kinase n=1 Tax=Kribbella ginsengisoli TaxID=363865 RepID=A0ABP6XE16_9ACTN
MNGEVLAGRYRLLAPLGHGGAGEVWRGEDSVLARPVAVKLLRRLEGDQMDAVERFRTEAQAAARLTHPNVVATYDVGTANGQVFLVMELVDGPDLAQLLRTKGLPSERFVADIAMQGARALDAAHAAGIVHRDVKPANFLLAPDGTLKITDFGIAQASGADGATGPVLLGTAGYVSPEQVRGERATPASDWYALGCVLYELLEGTTPFVGADVMDVMHQHLDAIPVPVRRTDTVPGLADLVMHLLAKDPAARPSSTTALAAYLVPTAPAAQTVDNSTRVLPLPAGGVGVGPASPADALAAGAGYRDGPAGAGSGDGQPPAAAGLLPAGAFDEHPEREEPSKRRMTFTRVLVGAAVLVVGVMIAALLREGVSSDTPAEAGGVPSTTPSTTVKAVAKPKATPTPTPSKTPSKKPTPKETPTKKPSKPQNNTSAALRTLAQMVRDHKQEHAKRTVQEAAKDLEQAAKALDEGDTGEAVEQYQQARQRLIEAQQQGRWQSTPQISGMFAAVGAALRAENNDGDTGNGWNRN